MLAFFFQAFWWLHWSYLSGLCSGRATTTLPWQGAPSLRWHLHRPGSFHRETATLCDHGIPDSIGLQKDCGKWRGFPVAKLTNFLFIEWCSHRMQERTTSFGLDRITLDCTSPNSTRLPALHAQLRWPHRVAHCPRMLLPGNVISFNWWIWHRIETH